MMILNCIGMAAIALGLSGCASVGRKIDTAQVERLEKGKSTTEEALAALGQPYMDSTKPDGSRVLVYTYAFSQVRPETLLPYIGPLVGGIDTTATSVALVFEPSGRLKDISSTTINRNAGVNLAATPR